MNQPVPIRGARVFLLPEKVSRTAVQPWLDKLAKREHPTAAKAIRQIAAQSSGDEVGVANLCGAFIQTTPGYKPDVPREDAATYEVLSAEVDWPELMNSIMVGDVDTGIDGKYAFRGVKPGYYFIYSEYQNDSFFESWFQGVKVEPGSAVEWHLHNNNAEFIEEKIPSW